MRLNRLWYPLVLLALVALSTLPVPATAAPVEAPAAQANLVGNADLEAFQGNGTATNWEAWWEATNNPGNGSLNYAFKPDFAPENNPVFVRSGGGSQHIGRSWDPWHAGIRQTITVAPGATVRITAFARAFASTPDYPAPSDSAVQARMQIGAEPNGSIEWYANTVKWSGMANPHDTWTQLSLDVTAGAAGKITIFLSADYRGDSRYHLDAWWDNVSATVISSVPATNPPAATSSGPANTQPPGPAPTTAPSASSRTATPNADGQIIYVVQANDTLWGIAAVHGITVDELRALNGLTSDFISVGQSLIIRQGTGTVPTATTEAGATSDPAATAAATTEGLEPTAAATEPGAENTPIAQVSPTPAGTGLVCALIWDDANGNGVRDANETLVLGGLLTVVDITTGQQVQAFTTSDPALPHCFEAVPEGQYTVSSAPPPGYNPTTPGAHTLGIVAGSTSMLEFGIQPSAAQLTPTPAGSNRVLRTALLGAGGIMFLLLAAGVAGFLFMRRPR
jgi:LysM repeat protein